MRTFVRIGPEPPFCCAQALFLGLNPAVELSPILGIHGYPSCGNELSLSLLIVSPTLVSSSSYYCKGDIRPSMKGPRKRQEDENKELAIRGETDWQFQQVRHSCSFAAICEKLTDRPAHTHACMIT
jgi:hypothetical protein